MGSETDTDVKKGLSSVFLEPAWIVALVAGIWGVVMSTEDFYFANCLAVIRGDSDLCEGGSRIGPI